jgi:hypothetical protein
MCPKGIDWRPVEMFVFHRGIFAAFNVLLDNMFPPEDLIKGDVFKFW